MRLRRYRSEATATPFPPSGPPFVCQTPGWEKLGQKGKNRSKMGKAGQRWEKQVKDGKTQVHVRF